MIARSWGFKSPLAHKIFSGSHLLVGPRVCVLVCCRGSGGASFGYTRVRFWGSSVSKRGQNCDVGHYLGVFWGYLATVQKLDCSQKCSKARGGGVLAVRLRLLAHLGRLPFKTRRWAPRKDSRSPSDDLNATVPNGWAARGYVSVGCVAIIAPWAMWTKRWGRGLSTLL